MKWTTIIGTIFVVVGIATLAWAGLRWQRTGVLDVIRVLLGLVLIGWGAMRILQGRTPPPPRRP